jgi:putative ABC transport system permease protein
MRSDSSRKSAIVLTLTFAVLAAVLVSVSALTLTADQEADKSFGRFERQTYATVELGDLGPGELTTAASRFGSAVNPSHVSLESTAIRPDAFAKTYVQAPLSVLRFIQDPNLRTAFPDRYALQEGHWPKAPMDVVVTKHLMDKLPNDHAFTVLSGRATFRIVGVLTDAYATRADTIVAAPGTWEAIPPAAPGHSATPVDAQIKMYFGPRSSITDVSRTITAALPRLADNDGASIIEENYTTRSQVSAEPVATFGSNQVAVSYLPLLLVVLLVSALVIGQARPPSRATADRLVAIGISRRLTVITQLVAVLLLGAGSMIAGLALGWAGGVALRTWALPHVADQRLSPLPPLDPIVIGMSAASLALIAIGTLWPHAPQSATRPSPVSRWLGEVNFGLIRRAGVALLIVAAMQLAAGSRSTTVPYLAASAAILLSPDLLRLVLGTLPQANPRVFLIRRLMRADTGRHATAVVVVACCIAMPTLIGTQLASKKASDATFTFSRIPSGQIWVQSDAAIGDVRGVARSISKVPGIGRPVVIRGTSSPATDSIDGSNAFFTRQQKTGRSSNAIMIVQNAEQIRRLIGHRLPAGAEAVLTSGGVLDFTRTEGKQRFAVFRGSERVRTTPEVETFRIRPDRQLRANFGGAVLLSTAKALDLPISEPTRYIYPDVSTKETEDAVQTAVDAGYDSEFVQYSVAPPPPQLPTYAYVFLAALLVGGFAVLLTVLQGQARKLRTYGSRLVAIGLTPRWTLSVLEIQTAIIVAVGLAAGVSAGILGVKMTVGVYASTSIPVLPIACAALGVVLAAGIATASAIRTLKAAEFHQAS